MLAVFTNTHFIAFQGEMINTFMNQIASLQVELRQLAQNQAETNLLIQQREVELEKERTVSHENKRKYEVGNIIYLGV